MYIYFQTASARAKQIEMAGRLQNEYYVIITVSRTNVFSFVTYLRPAAASVYNICGGDVNYSLTFLRPCRN